MNQKIKGFLIIFSPIILLLIFILIGMISFNGDSRYYPAVLYIFAMVIWGFFRRNKKLSVDLANVEILYNDSNSRSIDLMRIAMDAYKSSPESLRTRDMLNLVYLKMMNETLDSNQ